MALALDRGERRSGTRCGSCRSFVLGLLADLPRKNCWTIAEHAGDSSTDGMQDLLSGARWDAGAVRDDLRDYVTGHLGDPGAVLVVDETGDLKMRTGLEARQLGYVLAVAKSHRVNAGGGARRRAHRPAARGGLAPITQPARAPRATAATTGAWAGIEPGRPGHRWLLIRRHRRTGERAFYRCCAPCPVTLAALIKVAGTRWTVEEDSQASKGLAGWTSTRSAAGTPDTAGPPWPCSPPPLEY